MPGTGQLSTTPLQMLQRSLVNAASGMRSNGKIDVLDLRPLGVLRSTVDAIRNGNPKVAAVLGVVAPFALLTYAVHQHVCTFLDLYGLIGKVQAYFLSSITIPQSHPMHRMLLDWIARNTDTRGSSATLHTSRMQVFFDSTTEKDAIELIPNVASSWFRFNGRSFKLDHGPPQMQAVYGKDDKPISGWTAKKDSDITISCYSIGKELDPIKKFLAHVRTEELKESQDETCIYRIGKNPRDGWEDPIFVPARNMESVTMELATKTSLLHDVKTFISEQSKAWYSSRGIPWRRGYLLYGPPGTGKTSFASALAGHFGLSVYVLSLSNPVLTDDLLDRLMGELPPEKAVLLMEDVDSAGIQRSTVNPDKTQNKKGVTLAGLLNCLDGPYSAQGRILLLTSNTPDSLDPALIRPGRIDKKILFGNASHEIMRTMFLHIFTDTPGQTSTISTDCNLEQLADNFASQLPENKITPAELQSYLLEHRYSPVDAVDNAKTWIDALLLSKKRKRNVSEFADQIGDDEPAATAPVKADTNQSSATADTQSETSDAAAGGDEAGEQVEATHDDDDDDDDDESEDEDLDDGEDVDHE